MRNHWIDENTFWANNYVAQIERNAKAAGFRVSRGKSPKGADLFIEYGRVDGIYGMFLKPQNEGAKLWLLVNAKGV